MAADTAYAKSLGIEMGGYTLMQNPKNLTGDDTCHSPDARAGPVPTYIADFSTAFHRRYRENIVAFLRHMLARTLPLPLPLPLLLPLTRCFFCCFRLLSSGLPSCTGDGLRLPG